MTVTIEAIKQLRTRTGISLADCKQALEAAGGDFDGAVKVLRKNGLKNLEASAEATEGTIGSYVHHNNQVAVMVQVATVTDFAARADEVQAFARDVAMHIASAAPTYVSREDVPAALVSEEEAMIRTRCPNARPELLEGRILPGAMNSFYERICLLEQPFVKDPQRRVRDLLADLLAKFNEAITVRRFTRFKVGEE